MLLHVHTQHSISDRITDSTNLCFFKPDQPGKPEAMDVTKSSVSLVWTRPKHDGGSKLIGYYMEYTKLPEEKWIRCNANCINIQTENYMVTGLEEGQQYQFRVIAKTAINISLPSELSDPIAVIAENGTTPHSTWTTMYGKFDY